MPDFKALQARLDHGDVILLDGAIGTELQRMGIPMDYGNWSAKGLKTHPDTVRKLHADYIQAGCDIITTNSFSCDRFSLEGSDLEGQEKELTIRSAELAREAREKANPEKPVYIAGSVSRYATGIKRTADDIRKKYHDHACYLADTGVDLLLLEMLGGPVEQTKIALEEALATGLPAWVAINCWMDTDRSRLCAIEEKEKTVEQVVDEVMSGGATVLGIFHSEVEDIEPAAQAARASWKGPIAAYPHRGDWIRPDWKWIDAISPEDYLKAARGWVEQGVQIIGGCCGITVEHMRALRADLPSRVPAKSR